MNENKVSMKLLVFVFILTIVLSLVASYFVVTLSSGESSVSNNGEIIVNVAESEELFMAGEIKVVVGETDNS